MAYQILFLKDIPELKSRRGNAITPLLGVILGVGYPVDEAVAAYEWQDASVVATDDFQHVGSLLGNPNVGRWERVDLSQIPQVNADWNSTSGPSLIYNKPVPLQGIQGIQGISGNQGIQGVDGALSIRRARITTAYDGTYTWTYPTAFASGVVPIVGITAEGTSTTNYQHTIVGTPTNTSVSIKVTPVSDVTLLGIHILGIQTTSATVVHITAIAP